MNPLGSIAVQTDAEGHDREVMYPSLRPAGIVSGSQLTPPLVVRIATGPPAWYRTLGTRSPNGKHGPEVLRFALGEYLGAPRATPVRGAQGHWVIPVVQADALAGRWRRTGDSGRVWYISWTALLTQVLPRRWCGCLASIARRVRAKGFADRGCRARDRGELPDAGRELIGHPCGATILRVEGDLPVEAVPAVLPAATQTEAQWQATTFSSPTPEGTGWSDQLAPRSSCALPHQLN